MALDSDIKVLLVEDAATMRKMEVKILKQLGYNQVIEALDGSDAVAKLAADDDIRLVISDWNMPQKDGYALLQHIRADAKRESLPFIMATGQGDKQYVAKAMQAGANAVVAKPFTPEDLKTQIEAALGLQSAPAASPAARPHIDAAGRVHLKIAHIQITDHLTLGVMQHFIASGKHKPRAFVLETACMSGWNPVQSALENGTVNAAFILAPAAMDLFNYGVPIRLLMLTHRNGSICVRSRAEAYRKPYQQFFKHKSFYIPHKMSIHNMLAHMYFSRMGLKPGMAGSASVNVLFDVAPPVKMPAFLAENPKSAGFMVAEPIGSGAVQSGIAERQFLSSEIWNNHPCCVAVFREEFIARHPEAVQEFCTLLAEAGQFIAHQPDQSAQIAVDFLDPQKQLGLTEKTLKNVLTDPLGIRTDNLYPTLADLDAIQQYMASEMGVGSCIDLHQFVDLRFADAAFKVLGLSVPAETERPPALAGEKDAIRTPGRIGTQTGRFAESESGALKEMAGIEGKYLTFSLADERYGITIMDVREIIGMLRIRALPQLPEYIKGVINLREKVIPIVDLRLKFGMPASEYTDRTAIIIVEVSSIAGSTLMGVVVDTVWDVADIKANEVADVPSLGADVDVNCITGTAKKNDTVIMLLDIDRVLNDAAAAGV